MIHYKIFGEGSSILIIHGLFGSLDNWKSFSKQLSTSYQVIVVDLRNHGRSFWSDDFSYELMTNDIMELMNTLNIDSCHILGHSMGGKLGLSIANQHPEQVKSLIVVDIGFKKYKPGHEEIFQAVFNFDLERVRSRTEAEVMLQGDIPSIEIRQFILKSLSRTVEGNYRWRTNFRVLYEKYDEILDEVKVDRIICPILFIRGTQSNYIKTSDIELLERINRLSNVISLNAGHWIHVEKPKELLYEVELLLSSHV